MNKDFIMPKQDVDHSLYEFVSSFMHGLHERVGQHSQESRNNFASIQNQMKEDFTSIQKQMKEDKEDLLDKINSINDKVNTVNINAIEKNHKVELKVVSIASIVTLIISSFAEAIKFFIAK